MVKTAWPKPIRRNSYVEEEMVIRCRLKYSEYFDMAAADRRCYELHGTVFDGKFISGRYIVYWSKA
jgi:hypothetical protein